MGGGGGGGRRERGEIVCFSKRAFFFSGRKVDYKTKSLPSI